MLLSPFVGSAQLWWWSTPVEDNHNGPVKTYYYQLQSIFLVQISIQTLIHRNLGISFDPFSSIIPLLQQRKGHLSLVETVQTRT